VQFDGGPDHLVHAGTSIKVSYPNTQPAASLWYHDHAMGVTRTNVYAGLAALYWIRDVNENTFNLPKGVYEIPLVLQDKEFHPLDHNLLYPVKWQPEFFGDRNIVNGTIWPYLKVEARRYRFRIYNGASARFFNLTLSNVDMSSNSTLPFHQIGAEQGFLPTSAKLDHLLVANAERADVIVDFTGLAGKILYLNNDGATPFNPDEPSLDSSDTGRRIMKIIVGPTKSTDSSHKVPMTLLGAQPMPRPTSERIVLVHENEDFRFGTAHDGSASYSQILINNKPFGYDGIHSMPITHKVKKDTVQQWTYINTTPDTHPMHPHLVNMRVISRQKFDVEAFQRDYPNNDYPFPNTDLSKYYIGPNIVPEPNETGLKDTVRINPGEITKIVSKFDLVGTYVHHCHILEHEENDAMESFQVVP
jgi:spore coat protein A